jgi:hypothetical protein
MLSLASVVLAASVVLGQAEKVKIPPTILKSLEYYVGEWTYEYEEEGVITKGSMSVTWAPGKQCTIGNSLETTKKGSWQSTLVSGWDALKNQIVDTGYGADGSTMTDRWTIKSPTLEESDGIGVSPESAVATRKLQIEKKPDEFTWTASHRTEGDKALPDLTIVFHRIKK